MKTKGKKSKEGFEYQYFIKDHLGNTRVMLSQTGQVLQQNAYYPFGMLISMPQPDLVNQNKYLYNGKELQTDFGLDWYDYGARFYDAQLGRWHVVDPLAEEYIESSPYSYVINNPILNIDPDGMSSNTISKTVVNPDGRISYHDNSKDKNIYQSNYFASDGNTEGMEDIGDEEPWVDYSVGKYLMKDMYGNYSNLASNWYPQRGAYYTDLTIESFFIPLAPLFKYLKIGKYIYKLIPTKSGKFLLKFVGLADDAAKTSTKLWPAASNGRAVINGVEYTTHALERMQPVGTIMKGTEVFSRGVPPSTVENAIKFGKVTSGNTAVEVVRTFENVRVITNPQGTRVILVIKMGQ